MRAHDARWANVGKRPMSCVIPDASQQLFGSAPAYARYRANSLDCFLARLHPACDFPVHIRHLTLKEFALTRRGTATANDLHHV